MKKVLIAILLLGLLPHASADYIHWVDFRLSAPVLRSALELDMASQGGEQPLDWIDILALAAAWRGGTGVTVADTQRAAQALRGDTPPERLRWFWKLCINTLCGAVLLGLVNLLAPLTGLYIAVTAPAACIVGFFGLPGFAAVVLMQLFL